jgi:hypothetical protein
VQLWSALTMNPHLPIPCPDELGYSVLCRHAEAWHHCEDYGLWQSWTGNEASHRQLIEVVAGCRRLASHAYPSVADPQRHFVRNHTLLPYFAAFMRSLQRESAVSELQSSSPSAVRALAALTRSSTAAQRLRFCPECVALQTRRQGFPYWTRSAQLPGLSACPAHGCTFVCTEFGVQMRNQRDRLRPLDNSVLASKQRLSPPLMSRRLESRVAVRSLTALRVGLGRGEAVSVDYYRRQLFSAGYGNRRGEIRASAFVDDFHSWLHRNKAQPKGFGPSRWWLRLVTHIGGPTLPLHHILLREFLAVAKCGYDAVQPSLPGLLANKDSADGSLRAWELASQES